MALSGFILTNMEEILIEWEKFAQTLPDAHMDTDALRDHAESILRGIVEDISEPETRAEQEHKSKSKPRKRGSAESHASLRRRQGYDLDDMVAEYRALRASVVRLWTKEVGRNADADTLYELIRFDEAVDESWVRATARYSKELNRSRELLTGILGHDLRTPLGAILMSARTILDFGGLSDPNAKAARRILCSAEHMKDLVTGLLDVTRMRLGGSLPMTPRPSDLSNICAQAVEEVRAAHPYSQIYLETNGDLRGMWDDARLDQMLSNLLANAVQHGAENRRISVVANPAENDVLLRVHNKGEPIPPAAKDHIFDLSGQPDEGGKPASLGLGLYIVRAIAEAHGGTASVESSQRHGTTFSVILPRRSDQAIPGNASHR